MQYCISKKVTTFRKDEFIENEYFNRRWQAEKYLIQLMNEYYLNECKGAEFIQLVLSSEYDDGTGFRIINSVTIHYGGKGVLK